MTELQTSTIRKHLFAIVLVLVPLLLFTGCFLYTGSRGGVVVPSLSVKGAPANVNALALTVTGPGMKPVTSYFTSIPDTIEVEVPAGNDRRFELVAYLSPPISGAVLSLKGTATVDLVPYESKTISLKMVPHRTKLVIPDHKEWVGTSRIVQIDDMSGAGWTELDFNNANIPWPEFGFKPYDVDFDSQGRIYVANNYASTGYGTAFRVDDITGANFTLYPDKGIGMVAVAVDQYNDYLYYTSGSQLWRVHLDGTNDVALSTTGIDGIRGMAVSESGMLYIAGSVGLASPVDTLFCYDPDAQIVTGSYQTTIDKAWDIRFRWPYVYVANLDGAAGYKILQLDANLSPIDSYGSQSTLADSVVGNFYGPKRFIGILPKKLVILDEASWSEARSFKGDRLVSIDDLDGENWQSYGQSGTGIGQFLFYYEC